MHYSIPVAEEDNQWERIHSFPVAGALFFTTGAVKTHQAFLAFGDSRKPFWFECYTLGSG